MANSNTYLCRRTKRLKVILRGNQNPYIEEVLTTQWSKEKGQKDKQRSTKHYTENYRSNNMNPTKNQG